MEKADIGLIGLAVMGQNLVLNMERNGYCVAVYNRTTERMREFVDAHPGQDLVACETVEDLVAALEKPRKIMLMVKAGPPVDAVIEQIRPLLEPDDLLIDGGNSFFGDTERRSQELEADGVRYIGTGVSGGEEGALWGPSIMPGGQREAWDLVQPILEAIAARASDGEPCVAYMGPRGAGHYVKMVHNGIEYGDMQLIAEAYDILHRGLGLTADELHDVFDEWNKGELESYLIEISRDIFAKVDEQTGKPLLSVIVDEAKQKGTGKWTSQDALDLGAPTPTINAAVESRIVSAYKQERTEASKVIAGPEIVFDGDRGAMLDNVRDALYAAKVCSYAQGFTLLRAASSEYGYNLNYGEIAKIWRAGCIIRARLLEDIREAFAHQPNLTNLLLASAFRQAVESRQMALRRVVQAAVSMGIPVLAMSASLAYFDAYRTERLPANLTQAQRDYFGAHTYRRLDREGSFHTRWTE
jgi:6-phosphogluconate dehydrogenase